MIRYSERIIIFDRQLMLTGIVQKDGFSSQHQSLEKIRQTQSNDMSSGLDLYTNRQDGQNQHLDHSQNELVPVKAVLSYQKLKKLRKKENRRKNNQMVQEMQKQGKNHIGYITRLFCQRKAHWSHFSKDIKNKVDIFIFTSDFRQYIDELVQQWIAQLVHSFIQFNKDILNKNRKDPKLAFSTIVHKAYDIYLTIQQACQEIQQMINFFYRLLYQREDCCKVQENELGENTFFVFVTSCDLNTTLQLCKKIIEPTKSFTYQVLSKMLNFIAEYKFYDASTSGTEEDQTIDYILQDGNKKSKRKTTKEKAMQYSEDAILNRLQNMVICQEKRVNCHVSEEWSLQMQQKANKYRCCKNDKIYVQK